MYREKTPKGRCGSCGDAPLVDPNDPQQSKKAIDAWLRARYERRLIKNASVTFGTVGLGVALVCTWKLGLPASAALAIALCSATLGALWQRRRQTRSKRQR